MSNTPIRCECTKEILLIITGQLRGLRMEGVQVALLVDELYDTLADSKYMEFGSVDLNDIAGRMLRECEASEEMK